MAPFAWHDYDVETGVGNPDSPTNAANLTAAFAEKLDVAVAAATYAPIGTAADPVHAVFIGSSNVVTGTWPEALCTDLGWVVHNYSIGGGSFTGGGGGAGVVGTMLNMITTAIADLSYVHSLVKYVFIADAGNDIRALANVYTTAVTVFQAARSAYPNARIIMLPALWGQAAANTVTAVMYNVTQVVEQLRKACIENDVEFIDWSWTWHWDDTAWMLTGEVHYTAAGYTRVKRMVERYLRGLGTDVTRGWTQLTPSSAVTSSTAYAYARREGNNAHIMATFNTVAATGADTDLFTLPVGLRPLVESRATAVKNDRAPYAVIMFPTGQLRNFTSFSADHYVLDCMIPVF